MEIRVVYLHSKIFTVVVASSLSKILLYFQVYHFPEFASNRSCLFIDRTSFRQLLRMFDSYYPRSPVYLELGFIVDFTTVEFNF